MATSITINVIDIKQATEQVHILTKMKDLILNQTLPKKASHSITVELKSYDKNPNHSNL